PRSCNSSSFCPDWCRAPPSTAARVGQSRLDGRFDRSSPSRARVRSRRWNWCAPPRSLENMGLENVGLENTGLENTGLENTGLENSALKNTALQNTSTLRH